MPTSEVEVRFKHQQGDVSLTAEFADPIFASFRDVESLHEAVWKALGPLGLRLSEARWEGNGSVGDQHLYCPFWSRATTLRLRRERVELNCWDAGKHGEFWELAVTAIEAASSEEVPNPFRTFAFGCTTHGTLDEGTAEDFVVRFRAAAPDLGPIRGSGTAFYYGEVPPQVQAALTVDISGAVAQGLFVRLNVTWDATKLEPRNLARTATAHTDMAFEKLGLTRSD